MECALLRAEAAAACHSGLPYFWQTNSETGKVENGTIFHPVEAVLAVSAVEAAAGLVALAAEALVVAAQVEAGRNKIIRKGIIF